MPRPRLVALLLAAVVVSTSLTACVPQATNAMVKATAADAKWGQAPQRVTGVTLQPDVVIVSGGGSSVEQVTSDGLTWVLKKSAQGVDQLRVGKVMFVTGNGVGRVINLRTHGDAVAVTIAPVGITEVVRDGDFSVPKPIPLAQGAIAVGAPSLYSDSTLIDQVGQDDAFTDPDDAASGIQGSLFLQGSSASVPALRGGHGSDVTPPVPNLPVPNPAIPPLPDGIQRTLTTGGKAAQQIQQQDGNFDVTRSISAKEEGTAFSYDSDGVRIQGSLTLTTTRPTADFQLKISGGGIKLAEFKLEGAGALHASVQAATQPGGQVVKTSRWIGESLGFQVPIGSILGVPFSLWLGNQFKIQVRLPGSSWVKSSGDFSLAASMGFRYANGTFTNLTGGNFNAATSLQRSDSLSVGLSGLTVWDMVNFRIGIGWLGFNAGVDFSLDFRVNAEMGAPIGFNISQGATDPIEKCRRVAGYFGAEYGVGLSMPAPVREVINWFLKVFNSPPIPKDIKTHGKVDIKNIDKIYPESGFCK